ncbi:MAG: hypothetical protein WAM39_18350 [Bryobacteraceae bacterium]
MEIKRVGSQPSATGPSDWFTIEEIHPVMLSGSCPVKTLARSHFDDRHDAHRHSGEAQRESRGVDGACYRAAIPFWIERAPLEGPMFIDCRRALLAVSVLFACLASATCAGQRAATLGLTYDAQIRGPVPIPPSERGLQTVVAEPWFKVSHDGIVLEGVAFERDGNLLFCDVSGRRVMR